MTAQLPSFLLFGDPLSCFKATVRSNASMNLVPAHVSNHVSKSGNYPSSAELDREADIIEKVYVESE
jgi:phosphopantothenoylcysteine synthetase/decarboxylase